MRPLSCSFTFREVRESILMEENVLTVEAALYVGRISLYMLLKVAQP